MTEIARSYSRKISLTQFGYPYETIDIFSSRKKELPDKLSSAAQDKVSDELFEQAKADVERQEIAIKKELREKRRDLLYATQEANRMKAKAKYHRKIARKINELSKKYPKKTAGELEGMAKEEIKE